MKNFFTINLLRIINLVTVQFFSIEIFAKKFFKKIIMNKDQAGDGRSLVKYIKILKNHTDFELNNFFEVGANFCQDSFFVNKYMSIPKKNIFCFEPANHIYEKIKYNGLNVFKYAVSNYDGKANFNITNTDETKLPLNSGISSLKRNRSENVIELGTEEVECIKLSTFIKNNYIENIDFLKIDAEGNDFEVLQGLEDKIKIVKVIQIECSLKPIFDGEVVFYDINNFLHKSKFSLVNFELSQDNVSADALFINNLFLKDRKLYN